MRTIAVGLVLLAGVSAPARADLIGSIVTGQMLINGNPPNYFDPANGRVPATGYENSSSNVNGPAVPISATMTEFGFDDGGNTISADFGSTTLLLQDISNGGALALTFVFTDPAFAGLTLAKSSDTFPSGGLTASLSGTTLTINTPNTLGTGGTFTGLFTLTGPTSVPEPSPLVLAGVGLIAAAGVSRRRRDGRLTEGIASSRTGR